MFKQRLKTIFNQKLYKISHSHCFNVISLCPKLLKKFISNRDLSITNILLRGIHAHHPKLFKHQPRYESCLSVNPEKLKLSKYFFFYIFSHPFIPDLKEKFWADSLLACFVFGKCIICNMSNIYHNKATLYFDILTTKILYSKSKVFMFLQILCLTEIKQHLIQN